MEKIILASGSKNRQELLASLGFPFKVTISNFDEKSIKEADPSKRAAKIAAGKAVEVSKKHPGIIISADTFTLLGKKILEKPKTLNEARKMLSMLSSQRVTCFTGFCLINKIKKIDFCKTAITHLKFRKFYPKELEKYLLKFPVTSWAGAYAPSNLYGQGLIEYVNGSLTGLTHGLPIEFLIPLLALSGFEPKPV